MKHILVLFFLSNCYHAFGLSTNYYSNNHFFLTNYTLVVDTLIITNDTTICKGDSVSIKALPAFGYSWSPTNSLSNATIANPIAKPQTTTTYKLQTQKLGNNLVANSDFSAGNTGFTSQYKYSANGIPEGVYYVDKNSYPWHPFLGSNVDHTTGTGNMLLVNGDTVFNIIIWKQNFNIVPNTNYVFSVWLQSIYAGNPAELQFSINGGQIGNIFKASDTTGIWQQFYTIWNSGGANTAVISVVNKDTIKLGNDFALDDISFAELIINNDSVTVSVVKPPTLTLNQDTAICSGNALQLNATGANSYVWNASNYLSALTIANPIATPVKDTFFVVTGSSIVGCSSKDTVTIKVLPKPPITVSSNTEFCVGDSTGLTAFSTANSFKWTPNNGLSNSAIANPTAFPKSSTIYTVTVTDANTCTNSAVVTVTVNQPPVLILTKSNDANCVLGIVKLTATGAVKYLWYPAATLQFAATATPIATPQQSTVYHVKANSNKGCFGEDSIQVNVIKGVTDNGYLMPSAFTPNGDGINDCFGVKQWGFVSSLQLEIYNRFGTKIFASNNINNCWDGTYKGVIQAPGTYVYQVVATTNCGDVYRKGTVVLIR